MYTPKMSSRLAVEALGTFWLVFIGCGSAIFDAKFVARTLDGQVIDYGIGHLGVAIAFGLAVTTMAYAVGHVSGAHFNPAVTIGIAVAKRFEWREVPAYVGAQLVGGLLAGGALAGLLSSTGRPVTGNLAANGPMATPSVWLEDHGAANRWVLDWFARPPRGRDATRCARGS